MAAGALLLAGALPTVVGCDSDNGPPASAGGDGGLDAGPSGGEDASSPVECEPGENAVDPSILPECDQCSGTMARCVPADLLPEGSEDFLADCPEEGSKCVPDHFVETGGNFLLDTCESINGAEGRCLPDCIPDVQEQAESLPQDICDDGWLCAPCFDPFTGEDTGACTQGCDPGPEPTDGGVDTFEECCDMRGSCVPTDAVPADQQDQLGTDTCSEPDTLCAPDDLADPSFTPPTCDSIGDAEGRCLPDCLPDVQEQADRLPQASCQAGELCAPCYDPTTGEDTGACTLNGDEPSEPPPMTEACCDGRGTCLDPSVVPEEQQDQLGTDTCSEATALCAPLELTDPSFTPPTCDSIGDAEGRCLPDCLPDVQERADQLPQASCEAGDLCTPCYDPITGEETGACALNGDEPTESPYVFGTCCDYEGDSRGRCVPPDVVPESQQDALPQDDCDDMELCAPDPFLDDPDYSFPGCDAGLLGDGACVPDCLVDDSQAIVLSQGSCADGELCAPCDDPLSGEPSGACE
ncbi:MAG: hypothetical protein ACOC9O_02760 [Myxococcota bacterium]